MVEFITGEPCMYPVLNQVSAAARRGLHKPPLRGRQLAQSDADGAVDPLGLRTGRQHVAGAYWALEGLEVEENPCQPGSLRIMSRCSISSRAGKGCGVLLNLQNLCTRGQRVHPTTLALVVRLEIELLSFEIIGHAKT